MVLGRRSATRRLADIALLYEPTAPAEEALVPDFHSVRQALNVASADQRVLVVVHGPTPEISPLRDTLKSVSNDTALIGRFHYDFETDNDWTKTVSGVKGAGIYLIRSGEFGMQGDVMTRLDLSTEPAAIRDAMLQANTDFAATTKKKEYSVHVAKGRQEGIYFEGGVEYGEDRDGDGEIDRRRGRSKR